MSRRTQARIPYGLPPAVDLVPPAERARRELAALVRRWGAVVAGTVVLLAAAFIGTEYLARQAAGDLAREHDRTAALTQELAEYADVSRALRLRTTYAAGIEEEMRADLDWVPLYDRLRDQLPPESGIVALDALVVAPPAPGDAGDTGDTGGVGAPEPLLGPDGEEIDVPDGAAVVVTLTVETRSAQDHTQANEALRRLPDVLAVDLVSLESADFPTYRYTTEVTLADGVLSGRYAEEK